MTAAWLFLVDLASTTGKAKTVLLDGPVVAGPGALMLTPASASTAATPPSSFGKVFPPAAGIVALRPALCAGGAESTRARSAAHGRQRARSSTDENDVT